MNSEISDLVWISEIRIKHIKLTCQFSDRNYQKPCTPPASEDIRMSCQVQPEKCEETREKLREKLSKNPDYNYFAAKLDDLLEYNSLFRDSRSSD
jgi:hypothetical protein